MGCLLQMCRLVLASIVADGVVAVSTIALYHIAGEVSYRTLAEVKLLRNGMSFLRSAKAVRPLVISR